MRYGRWTVIEVVGRNWLCRCDCGAERRVSRYSLRSGVSTSCGCLRGDLLGVRARTHGLSKTPEYRVFNAMLDRCYRVTDRSYPRYGGRGIKVDPRWLGNFDQFIKDMGRRHNPRLTLERKDVNKDYSPENCVWETHTRQARNKSNTVIYTVRGVTGARNDLAEHFGVRPAVVKSRMGRGWSIEDAIFRPGRYSNRPTHIKPTETPA